jgi:GTP-binding protein Era
MTDTNAGGTGDGKSSGGTSSGTGGGDRRLTAGERNEIRRQERRAARRTEAGGGTPTGTRGAGATPAGVRRAKPGVGMDGKPTAPRREWTQRAPGAPDSRGSRGDGAPVGERKARTKKGTHKAAAAAPVKDDVYRAGFACFVGRPNAGKSTLTNAIIGQKIAITSSKPQTTRHIIRGILHKENAQLVLVDTPGLHRPRTLLGERLNDLVKEAWSEVDVIGICFPADEKVGRGDRFIAAEMAQLKATVIAVVTKVDLVDSARLAKHLLDVSELYDFADIVPVSALSGHQVDTLVDVMIRLLPPSPQLYPDDVLTEEPEQVLIGELIREASLEGVRDELPHSIAVLVEEMRDEGNLVRIFADVYVERSSQKSIVIGAQGARLKDVGTRARAEIEALLGDPKQLRKLGF